MQAALGGFLIIWEGISRFLPWPYGSLPTVQLRQTLTQEQQHFRGLFFLRERVGKSAVIFRRQFELFVRALILQRAVTVPDVLVVGGF